MFIKAFSRISTKASGKWTNRFKAVVQRRKIRQTVAEKNTVMKGD